MGVKVSHDDVVITGVEKKVKNRHEIERTGGVRGDVDVNGDLDLTAVMERSSMILLLGKS